MNESASGPTPAQIFDVFQTLPRGGRVRIVTEKTSLEAEYEWRDVFVGVTQQGPTSGDFCIRLRERDNSRTYFLNGTVHQDPDQNIVDVDSGSEYLGEVCSIERVEY